MEHKKKAPSDPLDQYEIGAGVSVGPVASSPILRTINRERSSLPGTMLHHR